MGQRTRSEQLKAFNELVSMKYQIYNGLFLILPFAEIENTGALLSVFASRCREDLGKGETPQNIVNKFWEEFVSQKSFEEKVQVLFQMLQFIERQVVLFDALEDAAFEAVHEMKGSGTLAHFFKWVEATAKYPDLKNLLPNYKTKIVLTAHPTQFYPSSILGIITELNESIRKNEINQINDLLLQMGRTPFKNKKKPTPVDEAKSLLWYLENIFYEVLPEIQSSIELETGAELKEPLLELGFWPGGDRDGNPFVRPETTFEVARMLKSSIIGLYLADIQKLKKRLTFDSVFEKLQEIENKLSGNINQELCRVEGQKDTLYNCAENLILDLKELKEILLQKHHGLFQAKLDFLILKVSIFGFHFAALDLRQDSSIHISSLIELTGETSYKDFSQTEKTAFLQKIIEEEGVTNASCEKLSMMTQDVIGSLKALVEVQKTNGVQGLSRYIISNTHSAACVLEIFVFAKYAGINLSKLILDVVPLFETVPDLMQADKIMEELYRNSFYKNYLKARGNTQTVMLGFSDGTKDGGYVTANWSIYKAKQRLTEVSRKHGIKIIFFDGRGGPPARGGGNSHNFYRSLGKSVENEQIHLTIQGQTISSNYGINEAAHFNLEQLFTAGLESKLFAEDTSELSPSQYNLLEELSEASFEAYYALRQHPLFLPYLEEATPLNFYSSLNIGSRPARRKTAEIAKFEDLRAIPFVGAWTQMKQNIPGFYGLGSGLRKLIEHGKKEELQEFYKSSLFFKTLLENAMQSLCKANFALTGYLRDDTKFGEFWQILYAEAQLTEQLLKEISGQSELLETSLAGRESIRLREKIVLPLLVIQHFAMSQVRAMKESEKDFDEKTFDAFSKIIIKSLAATVNASRNSV